MTSTSRYFKLTSQAQVGDARRTLTMVIRHAPTDAQKSATIGERSNHGCLQWPD